MFIDVGFNNFVNASLIININNPGSSPARRLVDRAKEGNYYIDSTQGRKTRSIIVLQKGTGIVVVSSSMAPRTFVNRIESKHKVGCVAGEELVLNS